MPSTTTARPNKTVHSYEQMLLELANKQLIWRYGLKADDSGSYGTLRRVPALHHRTSRHGEERSEPLHHRPVRDVDRIREYKVGAQGMALQRSRTALSRISPTAPEVVSAD